MNERGCCMNFRGIYKKNYISSIKLDDRLCPETADGDVTLRSIYCGSIIKNLEFGGSK